MPEHHKRRWRFYTTIGGACPVEAFLDMLSDEQQAAIYNEMRVVEEEGISAARHLRGDLYEVRASFQGQSFRVLFATEGRFGQVLLALEAISKKTRKTPPPTLDLAEKRLSDWRARGRVQKGRGK
jgi:phage-related protein